MELKTKIEAEDGKQDLFITRDFDLPVELLFTAYSEPELIEQWMGTKVLKHESRKHGSYKFETKDADGNILFGANGTIHEFIPNTIIIRTFEMENAAFDAQLEFLEFESLPDNKSRLNIHSIFRSNELRDKQLKMPFVFGLNMAHNKLEEILKNRK